MVLTAHHFAVKPLRLLVVKPSSLGDIVHGLQVVASLKAQLPAVAITWVVRDIFSAAIRCSGLAQSIIAYQRDRGLRGLWSCCRHIRRSGTYDGVWDMQGLFRSALMTRAARSPRRIGRSDAREGAALFYGERVPQGDGLHAVEILSQFLPTLGAEAVAARPLHFTAEEALPAELGRRRCRIAIAPESRGEGKEWPHYDELTANLCRRFPRWEFLWLGMRSGGDGRSRSFANFLDLRGKTSLAQLFALMGHCDGAIANDSACLHIAAALDKPVLGIFLRTDPRRCGPYPLSDPNHVIVRNPPAQFTELEDFLERIAP
jgi:ADP-heptose:LPS heptosyltransferase